MIADRRRTPGADLLSNVLSARDDATPVADEELVSVVGQLLHAGTQTTEVLLTQGLPRLLQHPRQLALLRAEPALISTAVDECLRYLSPIRTMAQRVTEADIAVGEATLPKGDELAIWFGAANRDPRVFENADTFDIRRNPNPHLAFSTGAHFCLGAHLARLEATIALGTLVHDLPTLALVPGGVEYGESSLRPKLTKLEVSWQ